VQIKAALWRQTPVRLFFYNFEGNVIFLTLALLMKKNLTVGSDLVSIEPIVRILKSSQAMLGWA
jgi:hypothetical protein